MAINIKIKFESSWSNSFFRSELDEQGLEKLTPLFTSSVEFGESMNKLDLVAFDQQFYKANKSIIPHLQALQNHNNKMGYRVPDSFEKTVEGIVARLMGQVQRVSDLKKNHFFSKLFAAIHHSVEIESEYSQTIRLATYAANDIRTAGCGLVNKDILYSANPLVTKIMGHLDLSLEQLCSYIESGDNLPRNWWPTGPSSIVDRISFLNGIQKNSIDQKKKHSTANKIAYVTPFLNVHKKFEKILSKEVETQISNNIEWNLKPENSTKPNFKPRAVSIEQGVLDEWSIPGAFIVYNIKNLTPSELEEAISLEILTKKGGLAGLAMTGSLGGLTEKDIFKFATGTPAFSYSMPYRAEIPFEIENGKKEMVQLGVLKKTGVLTIVIENLDDETEEFVYDTLNNSGVGIFHFGKKGVAYITDLSKAVTA